MSLRVSVTFSNENVTIVFLHHNKIAGTNALISCTINVLYLDLKLE